MRKFALALMSAAALVFGFGIAAQAAYPPGNVGTTSPSAVFPGGTFTVTINCVPGAGNVTFSITGTTITITVPCRTSDAVSGSIMGFLGQTASGTATGTLTAPTAPGTYQGTGVQAGGAASADFTIVVQQATTTTAPGASTTVAGAPTTVAGAPTTVAATGAGLPATGSGGMGTTTTIAIGLLVVGLGLFVVAQVRRRQPTTA
jgi:hypothetical protein